MTITDLSLIYTGFFSLFTYFNQIFVNRHPRISSYIKLKGYPFINKMIVVGRALDSCI